MHLVDGGRCHNKWLLTEIDAANNKDLHRGQQMNKSNESNESNMHQFHVAREINSQTIYLIALATQVGELQIIDGKLF